MPHPDEARCTRACAYTLDNLTVNLSQLSDASAPEGPPDIIACVQTCQASLVPIEHECLVRALDLTEVHACFERPRAHAYRFDAALRTSTQRQSQYIAREGRTFPAP
jgi:hypothetical protein